MKIIYTSVVENGQRKRKAIVLEEKQCKVCGKQYQPSRQDSIICVDCSGKQGHGKYVTIDGMRRWLILQPRKCLVCSNEFDPKQQGSKYCSRKCGKAAEYKFHSESAKKRAREWYANNKDNVSEKRKARYWANPEKARSETKEWITKNSDKVKTNRTLYKDKVRHGSKRAEIIAEQKGLCFMCNKDTSLGNKNAHLHHYNFDSTDHEHQVLVCNSCHAKIHLHGHSLKKYISPTTT